MVKIHTVDVRAKFVVLNRNFAHYPLARPLATAPRWQNASARGARRCRVHRDATTGKARVVLYLFKKDIKRHPDIKRSPNRYDVDALHQLAALTAMAQTEERHHST